MKLVSSPAMKLVRYHINGVLVAQQIVTDGDTFSRVNLLTPGDTSLVTVSITDYVPPREEDTVGCIGVGV